MPYLPTSAQHDLLDIDFVPQVRARTPEKHAFV